MHVRLLCKRSVAPVFEEFERRIRMCRTSFMSMQSVLEEFITCDCICRAERVGMEVRAFPQMSKGGNRSLSHDD